MQGMDDGGNKEWVTVETRKERADAKARKGRTKPRAPYLCLGVRPMSGSGEEASKIFAFNALT
jgi:hypothetical protein